MSRDLDWGIPVPVEGAEGKVLYVWFDAPIGYISATKDLTPDWEKYWKSGDTKMVHFIGKDNIVFHCIVFPAMLKAHGGYILPENVPANEFLNLEGEKISTSRNWAVWLHEYLDEFPGKEDVLRYVLCECARGQGQRLHVEGFPGPQQQRAGGRAGQLREPGPGADSEILRRRGARMRRFDRLRPRDDRGAVADQGGARKRHRELQVPREALKEAMNFARIGQQVSGRHRAVESRQE